MSSGDKKLSRRELFSKLRPQEEPAAPPQDSSFDLLGLLQRIQGGADATVSTKAIPVLRPPGAIEESAFLKECTRCAACIEACPHGSILMAGPQLRTAAGSPILDPLNHPCQMCEDTPCITACNTMDRDPAPSAVLLPGRGFAMGKASIKTSDCLAYQGGFCTTCSERCPVEAAIVVTLGKPRIVADKCTGCGICHHVCPAPWNAIIVMPELQRKPRPSTSHETT